MQILIFAIVTVCFIVSGIVNYMYFKTKIKELRKDAALLETRLDNMQDWIATTAQSVSGIARRVDETGEKCEELRREFDGTVREYVSAQTAAEREFERGQQLFNEGLRSITDFTGGTLPRREV